MAEDLIRYDILAQDALRGVIRKVLSEVSRTGLPGEHHFFVTFATNAPGVRISSRLLAKYPQEISIVLQHQYWDLSVTEQAFEVGLSFKGIPERLLVPFAAIKTFADPSVQFELRFEVAERPAPAASPEIEQPADANGPLPLAVPRPEPAMAKDEAPREDAADAAAAPVAEVVSLDAFRKK